LYYKQNFWWMQAVPVAFFSLFSTNCPPLSLKEQPFCRIWAKTGCIPPRLLLQHIFCKNCIATGGICHKDMGDCSDQLSVLKDWTSAHALDDAAGLFSASYSAWSRAKAASLQRSTRPCRAATSSGASPRLATISGVSRDGSVRGRTKTPKGIKEMKRL